MTVIVGKFLHKEIVYIIDDIELVDISTEDLYDQ